MMESGGQYNVFPMTEENCDPNGAIVRDGEEKEIRLTLGNTLAR